jgi:DNA-directed RNA polymerase specialized sigma24 family protein
LFYNLKGKGIYTIRYILGGKIPKNIKEKVIRQWLHGLTRERIAREDDIGAGTVTAIIQEARKQPT